MISMVNVIKSKDSMLFNYRLSNKDTLIFHLKTYFIPWEISYDYLFIDEILRFHRIV